MLMLLCGIGIAGLGIWFAVTGSLLAGIIIAAIGVTVVAIIQGAEMVCLAIKSDAARLATDIEGLTREHGSLAGSLAEIEGGLSHLADQVRENTKYIAAAILAAPAGRDRIDEPPPAASVESARRPPPYVAISGAEIAAEVLRQRLLGNSHDRSIALVAAQLGRPETLISEAWRDNRPSAFNLVLEEARTHNWVFTEEAKQFLREIFPSGAKRRGGLDETVAAIRKDFINTEFRQRVDDGETLDILEDEAKAILDRIRESHPEAHLPSMKTVIDIIHDDHSEYCLSRWRLERQQRKEFRNALGLYKRITFDLGLYHDFFARDI